MLLLLSLVDVAVVAVTSSVFLIDVAVDAGCSVVAVVVAVVDTAVVDAVVHNNCLADYSSESFVKV